MLKEEVTLIEAISPTDRGQDKPILAEFFKMLDYECKPQRAYGRASRSKNKDTFLKALLHAPSRFIHVSAHGSESGGLTIDSEGKKAQIAPGHIGTYCRKQGLSEPLKHKLVTSPLVATSSSSSLLAYTTKQARVL